MARTDPPLRCAGTDNGCTAGAKMLRAEPGVTNEFAGIPLWTGKRDDAVRTVLDDACSTSGTAFRLVNSYTLYCADSNPGYRAVLTGAGINFVDGRPLAWVLARLRRGRAVEQVRGPGLCESCLDAGRGRTVRHFLLGGSPELLDALQSTLSERYPGVDIVGTYAPPFRAFTNDDRASFRQEIERTQPGIVWVGLGTPRQDVEAALLTTALGVTTVAVGAAFDFAAGRKAEAPALVQTLGLEWGFRLLSEPSRLWRRYLFGNSYFMYLALRELVPLRRRDAPSLRARRLGR